MEMVTTSEGLLIPTTSDKKKAPVLRTVMDRLTTIRVGKSKIIKLLRTLKEKDDEGERIDRDLIDRLISSYDGLKKQEEEYIDALINIVDLHKKKDQRDSDGGSVVECKPSIEEGTNIVDKNRIVKLLTLKKDDLSEDDFVEFVNFIDGSGDNSSAEAYLASQLNDQIKTKIQLIYEEKKMMDELHKKELHEKVLEAKLCLEKAKVASLKLANESFGTQRKRRQLERLRKKAVKCGYISPEAAADPDNENESSSSSPSNSDKQQQPENEGSSTVGNRANSKCSGFTRTNSDDAGGKDQQDNNKLDDGSDEIIDKFDGLGLRIPPIPTPPVNDNNPKGAKLLVRQQHCSAAHENSNDELRVKISSRFASIEARKQQMRFLRSKLNTLGQQQKMDATYNNAVLRIRNLEEMRKCLEEKISGHSLTHNEIDQKEDDGNSGSEGPLTADSSTVIVVAVGSDNLSKDTDNFKTNGEPGSESSCTESDTNERRSDICSSGIAAFADECCCDSDKDKGAQEDSDISSSMLISTSEVSV